MTYCGFVSVSVHCLDVQIEGLYFASYKEGIKEHMTVFIASSICSTFHEYGIKKVICNKRKSCGNRIASNELYIIPTD